MVLALVGLTCVATGVGASRKAHAAGWESGWQDGELVKVPPAAYMAIRVELKAGVVHVPGHLKKDGGLVCVDDHTIQMRRGALDSPVRPGMVLYGTGCEDWSHQMFAKRVLQVRPHTDHPDSTVVAEVEDVPMKEVLAGHSYMTYLPPTAANDTVVSDGHHESRASYDSWRNKANEDAQGERHVSEVHDLDESQRLYQKRRHAAQLAYNTWETFKVANFPSVYMSNSVQADVYYGRQLYYNNFLSFAGTTGWNTVPTVEHGGSDCSLKFYDGCYSDFQNFNIVIHGYNNGYHTTSRFELYGPVSVKLAAYLKSYGPTHVKFDWKRMGYASTPTVGLALDFTMGFDFISSGAVDLQSAGYNMIGFNVRIGRQIDCPTYSGPCYTTNIYSRAGPMSMIAPQGHTPYEPVQIEVNVHIELVGWTCFPSCYSNGNANTYTVQKSTMYAYLGFNAKLQLTPKCDASNGGVLTRMYHEAPYSWCSSAPTCPRGIGSLYGMHSCTMQYSGGKCYAERYVYQCPVTPYTGCERCHAGMGSCMRYDNDPTKACQPYSLTQPSAQLCGTFVGADSEYPGYFADVAANPQNHPSSAPLKVYGTVRLVDNGGNRLTVEGTLTGLESTVSGGLHVHEGFSCPTAGPHFIPPPLTEDPWANTMYDTTSTGEGRLDDPVLGVALSANSGRAMVVHDSLTNRVACVIVKPCEAEYRCNVDPYPCPLRTTCHGGGSQGPRYYTMPSTQPCWERKSKKPDIWYSIEGKSGLSLWTYYRDEPYVKEDFYLYQSPAPWSPDMMSGSNDNPIQVI